MRHPFTLLVLLAVVGCSDSGRDAPVDAETAPPVASDPVLPSVADAARLDTLRLSVETTVLPRRPRSPLIVDGGCPFEGCQYGAWTTSESTTVYTAAGDTTAAAFAVPARTPLTADRGFVLITRAGRAVARRATTVYTGAQETRPVAAGDTLTILDSEGEGFFRVWADGVLGASDEVISFGDDGAFDLLDEPRAQWWAHVTLADGRSGWLWMDRTPRVLGTDALS